MALIFCEKHGWKGGEKVSKVLSDKHRSGADIAEEIRDFSFVIEEFECLFYGLQEEIEQLPDTCVNGDFIIQSEGRLDEVLDRITIICGACLVDAMKGAPLPIRVSGG